jgi:hypothetical protein
MHLVLLARALLDQLAPARELPAQRRRLIVRRPHLAQEPAREHLRQRARVDLVGLGRPGLVHGTRVGQHQARDMRAQQSRNRQRVPRRLQDDMRIGTETLREQRQRLRRRRHATRRPHDPILDDRDLAEAAVHVEPHEPHP